MFNNIVDHRSKVEQNSISIRDPYQTMTCLIPSSGDIKEDYSILTTSELSVLCITENNNIVEKRS